ncbi:MAG: riboflavin synthase subunit alpha [Deltaproteobacteria bacterium RBG_13_49_15]|nr:MAG: riboflavin synthase subunit alpha [Deltaproteobacteria bacterium RBG_13_49_15]
MFTGIIEGLGTISGIQSSGMGKRLLFISDFELEETKVGDSIAVNGACLTAATLVGKRFAADASPETLSKTTLGQAKIGERVNLERALRLSDRLGGHLVLGHVDGIGRIIEKKTEGNATRMAFFISEELSQYIIQKGSVAVDGISLTVNICTRNGFEVTIIPHTIRLTTLGMKKRDDLVNIETDMIGKYVKRFILQTETDRSGQKEKKRDLDLAYLEKTGFL